MIKAMTNDKKKKMMNFMGIYTIEESRKLDEKGI